MRSSRELFGSESHAVDMGSIVHEPLGNRSVRRVLPGEIRRVTVVIEYNDLCRRFYSPMFSRQYALAHTRTLTSFAPPPACVTWSIASPFTYLKPKR